MIALLVLDFSRSLLRPKLTLTMIYNRFDAYHIDGGVVTIPPTITEITEIGDEAFLQFLESEVHIPNSVLAIGRSAFRDCGCIRRMIIPDSVTTLGESCFEGCSVERHNTLGKHNLPPPSVIQIM